MKIYVCFTTYKDSITAMIFCVHSYDFFGIINEFLKSVCQTSWTYPHTRISAYPHTRISAYPHIRISAYPHIRIPAFSTKPYIFGLNGKHGAGVPESEFRSRSLGVGAPECDVKKWKTRSTKYGKHGVWESDVKYGKHGVRRKKYGKHGV